MDGKENTRIIEFLLKNNASPETITKKQMTNLEKVDAEIQRRLTTIQEAKSMIKSNTINIFSIAKATDISNKTFYNNNLLKMFVESFSEKNEQCKIDEKVFKRMQAQNNAFEEQIRGLILRDIDLELMQHEIDALHREINKLKEENQLLHESYEVLYQKQNGIRNKTKIVPLKPQN